MRNFLKIAEGADTLPLLYALQRRPDLWNQDRCRTTFAGSPHEEVDDVLLRFEDLAAVDGDLDERVERAPRIWRQAWRDLPEVKALILPLMARVGGYELTRVMITRLRPGACIIPHADVRGSYANLPDIGRYHVVLQGLPGSLFHCGAETVQMLTGEVWAFNAREVHSCQNNSADDRIHLLVDLRLMP